MLLLYILLWKCLCTYYFHSEMPLSKRATICRDTKNNMLPTYRSLQNIAFMYIIVRRS